MQNLLAIGGFGLLGVLSRYGADKALSAVMVSLPLSTFLVNVSGSFLAGCLFALGEKQVIHPTLQLGLLVGFCGGFTTFSAYALQAVLMAEKERALQAALYFCVSPIVCFAVAFAGLVLMRKFAG